MASPTKKPGMRINRGSGDRDGGLGSKKYGKGTVVCSNAFSSPPNFTTGHKGKNTNRSWN